MMLGARNWGNFTRLVKENHSKINVYLFGDSATYMNNHTTVNTFLHTMAAQYPETRWNFDVTEDQSTPDDAFESVASGRKNLTHVHVIILQYVQFANHAGGHNLNSEAMLRMLLQLPQKPLVLIVHHCCMMHWAGKFGFRNPEGYQWWDDEWHKMRELAEHYQVPTISACSALDALVSENCTKHSEKKCFKSPRDMQLSLFGQTDKTIDSIHYNTIGGSMEGCLLAEMVESGLENLPSQLENFRSQNENFPEPLEPASMPTAVTVFILSTRTGDLRPDTDGWELVQGGNRGKKKWYNATRPNATMTFLTPPCTQLFLQYYKHHELPMGIAEITVDGVKTAVLDACCPGEGCAGIPSDQGFPFMTQIASRLPLEPHIVEVKAVQRQSAGACSQFGNKFDVVSLVGKKTLVDKKFYW
eukprot:gnl/TRDRNA2_/TRDRNA2_176700_c8_seq5.p1 gnl/TRDRNA2_/TRDRNA2_176700_c8~~gnl/TRDRNA2_/TRDRNA2_176700_c8_seq5.p1  ORF type:complete len:415 (-),score=45.21 gnl/TRDRNA2_/TRDRNA2_176700_c8_seq5:66-1310(-)